MAYNPTGVKITPPSTTRTASGIKVQRSAADIASRSTGSIKSGRDPVTDPLDVKVTSGDWSSVTTDGDTRKVDHQSVTPTTKTKPSSREAESSESLGYGTTKNP